MPNSIFPSGCVPLPPVVPEGRSNWKNGRYIRASSPAHARPSWAFLLWSVSWLRTVIVATDYGARIPSGRLLFRNLQDFPKYYAEMVEWCNHALSPMVYGNIAGIYQFHLATTVVRSMVFSLGDSGQFARVGARKLNTDWRDYVAIRGEDNINHALLRWREWQHNDWNRTDPLARTALAITRMSHCDLDFAVVQHPYLTLLNWHRYYEMLLLISVVEVSEMIEAKILPHPGEIFGESLQYRPGKLAFTISELIEPL